MTEYFVHKNNVGEEWDLFVQMHEAGNAFQTSAFFEFYLKTKEFKPYYCIARNTLDKKIIGGFLFAIQRKSARFPEKYLRRSLIIGGPLISGQNERVLDGLLKVYNDFTKNKAIYSEIRNLRSWSDHIDVFLKNKFRYEAHLNYQIALKNRDVVAAFSASKRRQIRKSQQNGAAIVENPNIHQVKEFYKILANLYNRKINKPLPDWSFFESFHQNLVLKGHGKYLLVEFEGKIIGGIMLPAFEHKMVYEWYVAGLDREYKHAYPSVLATWAGIKYAMGNGFDAFDFMGAGVPSHSYGVREFKSKFGGQILNYGRFTNSHYPIFHWVIKIFLKLYSKNA
jgi:lipid II:glycine glycyltransferase (peptidoglycan interpeptide bridge formation enzyme)